MMKLFLRKILALIKYVVKYKTANCKLYVKYFNFTLTCVVSAKKVKISSIQVILNLFYPKQNVAFDKLRSPGKLYLDGIS